MTQVRVTDREVAAAVEHFWASRLEEGEETAPSQHVVVAPPDHV